MGVAAWIKPPRQVLLIFVFVVAASAAALGALAWQLLDQDRDLELQRRQVRLEKQADALVVAMQQSLASLQGLLASAHDPEISLPPGVVLVSIAAHRVVTRPAGSLAYCPTQPHARVSGTAFDEGERLEFATGDLAAAADAYSHLVVTGNSEIRGGALLRLARVQRKQGALEAALQAYASLDKLDTAVVEELPASLLAKIGRMTVFETARAADDLRRESAALLSDLRRGRWCLSKAQYDTYAGWARLAVPDSPPHDSVSILRSEVADWLWQRRGAETPITRRTLTLQSGQALVVWVATPGQLYALIADPVFLSALGEGAIDADMRWTISDPEGRALLGASLPATATARTALTSGLPWTVHVSAAERETPLVSPRRRLVTSILGLVAVVLSAGWYFVFRSFARERQVARLQSDFVAAVSHEFRSPLTALTHAADLLVNDRLTSEGLRRQTYQVLARDTARLRSLVEGLLTFGRLESGAAFRFEETELVALVQSAVADIQEEVAANGYVIDLRSPAGAVPASVDRETMSIAIRNLLDNAVKYSPGSRHIEVTMTHETDIVAIAVRDRGLGIPEDEQRTIFDRFVRGAESISRRIQGTGIGLAMVREIVQAHGGEIHVSSSPGEGSVFTMKLPVVAGAVGQRKIGGEPAARPEVAR